MNEAEEILKRLESKGSSYRAAFCFALIGLATLAVASITWRVPEVIRTKMMVVQNGKAGAASIGVYKNRIAMGTVNGSTSLVSVGEGTSGAGAIVVGAASGKKAVSLVTTKNAGGSVGINGADEVEIANASPNSVNAGSLFIDNSAGGLIGEANGDEQNGGAIIVKNAKGVETGRVHQ